MARVIDVRCGDCKGLVDKGPAFPVNASKYQLRKCRCTTLCSRKRIRLMKHGVWLTAKFRKIPLTKMELSHIRNAMKFVDTKARVYACIEKPDEAGVTRAWVQLFLNELVRRGHSRGEELRALATKTKKLSYEIKSSAAASVAPLRRRLNFPGLKAKEGR